MRINPVTPESKAQYLRSDQSLDAIAGYLTVQTIAPDGTRHTDNGEVVVLGVFPHPNEYGKAMDLAHQHRHFERTHDVEYAIVYTVNRDGFHPGHWDGITLRYTDERLLTTDQWAEIEDAVRSGFTSHNGGEAVTSFGTYRFAYELDSHEETWTLYNEDGSVFTIGGHEAMSCTQ